MTAPAVLVIGAGSIGTRHVRNLVAAGADVAVTDPDVARASVVPDAKAVPFDLGALGRYDGVVVASPTRHHAEQAAAALDAGAKVFVEKPIAMSTAEAEPLARRGEAVMVGYNLRFHKPIRRLQQLTSDGAAGIVRSCRFWFGSYLPDWRPGVDYRTTYSAQAALGGGVLLDAIHELDLAVWWFGPELSVVGAMVDRLGALEIDVEDTVRALLRTGEGVPVEISLDYLSRRYRRGVEVIGDLATLRFDWARQVIEVETAEGTETTIDATPVASSYERQAEHFVGWLRGEVEPLVDGRAGLASLTLADAIRAAA